jgi:hypothetical protein
VTAARHIVVDLDEQRLAALGGPSGQRAAQFSDALTDLLHGADETSTGAAPSPPSHPEPTQETHR